MSEVDGWRVRREEWMRRRSAQQRGGGEAMTAFLIRGRRPEHFEYPHTRMLCRMTQRRRCKQRVLRRCGCAVSCVVGTAGDRESRESPVAVRLSDLALARLSGLRTSSVSAHHSVSLGLSLRSAAEIPLAETPWRRARRSQGTAQLRRRRGRRRRSRSRQVEEEGRQPGRSSASSNAAALLKKMRLLPLIDRCCDAHHPQRSTSSA